MEITESMDLFKELQEKDEWEHGDSSDGMTVDEITTLAKRGLGRCPEDDCFSREVCGEDACRCVRTAFPTPQHYKVYLDARDFFQTSLAKAALAAFVSESIQGEKNDT